MTAAQATQLLQLCAFILDFQVIILACLTAIFIFIGFVWSWH